MLVQPELNMKVSLLLFTNQMFQNDDYSHPISLPLYALETCSDQFHSQLQKITQVKVFFSNFSDSFYSVLTNIHPPYDSIKVTQSLGPFNISLPCCISSSKHGRQPPLLNCWPFLKEALNSKKLTPKSIQFHGDVEDLANNLTSLSDLSCQMMVTIDPHTLTAKKLSALARDLMKKNKEGVNFGLRIDALGDEVEFLHPTTKWKYLKKEIQTYLTHDQNRLELVSYRHCLAQDFCHQSLIDHFSPKNGNQISLKIHPIPKDHFLSTDVDTTDKRHYYRVQAQRYHYLKYYEQVHQLKAKNFFPAFSSKMDDLEKYILF